MTTKEFMALEKRLLPAFPGFAIRGRLMITVPLTHTLIGFNFEPSGFSKSWFYASWLFMPLCVPRQHVSYEFGDRVRGTFFKADQPDVEQVLTELMLRHVPYLTSLQDPFDVIEAARTMSPELPGPYRHEAIAYLLALYGKPNEAITALDELLGRFDQSIGWQLIMANRARMLREKLMRDPEEAHAQLRGWENESIRNLKLDGLQK